MGQEPVKTETIFETFGSMESTLSVQANRTTRDIQNILRG